MASPFVARDGSRHTNRETARRADARFAAGTQRSKADPGRAREDPYDAKKIVRSHGAAIEVNIIHSASKHTVHAEHYDGHAHDTEHPTREAAHRFAAEVAGVGDRRRKGRDETDEDDDGVADEEAPDGV